MKKKRLPFKELSIELTHKCVLDCIFCSSSASENPIINEDIDFQRIKEIIQECKEKFKIEIISLSGGEPLIYPFFKPLLEFILENNIDVLIYTSGIIFEKNNITSWSNELIEYFIDLKRNFNNEIHFIFDIQAPDKKNYEAITRKSGSYDKLIETLNKLRNVKIFKKSSHFVPFKFNWKLINETLAFCLSYNFEHLKVLRFVEQGRASNFTSLELNLEEFYLLQRNLLYLKNRYMDKIKLGHPIDFLFLIDPQRKIRACRGGINAPIILPNGFVYPCPAWKNIQDLSAGNIYNSNFEEIWHNEYFECFRNFIKNDYINLIGLCKDCKNLNECKGKCVAQRILKYYKDPRLPDCLKIGPDPSCLKLYNRVL